MRKKWRLFIMEKIKYFQNNFSYITESIFSFAIWADNVDVDVCRMIASQLELKQRIRMCVPCTL